VWDAETAAAAAAAVMDKELNEKLLVPKLHVKVTTLCPM